MHRIVLTRQPGQTGRFESELTGLGVAVELLPLIDFALPIDDSLLAAAKDKAAAGAYDWIVLTSPNAVRSLHKLGYFDEPLPVKWGMVGSGTAAVFADHAQQAADFVAEHNQSGEGLVAEFPPPEPAGRNAVLLPVSEIASNTVQQGLHAAGFTVERVTAYRTVAASTELPQEQRLLPPVHVPYPVHGVEAFAGRAARAAAVVLTSPSNARLYAAAAEDFPALALPPLLAMGQPTAAAMTATGLPITAVLPKPDVRSVYRWLTEHLPPA